MSPPRQGRRRYHRRTIDGVTGTLSRPGDVRVLDLSPAGLSFESPVPLRPGERCFLELRHDRHTASVEAEVRWSAPATSGDAVCRAGGRFLDVLRNDSAPGIWAFITVDPAASAA